MENVKNDRLNGLLDLYDMQTEFFKSAIDGISDEDTHNRLNTKANHIAWLAGSIVRERYELANQLGTDEQDTAFELFRDNKGIQDNTIYPTLEVYKKDWEHISPILKKALVEADEQQLGKRIDMMPGETISFYEFFSFSIYREANIIGQIALWRRLLNYPAMKYM